jgi:HPt (histidine-containing phosphotransfer) domain-containing protein
MEENTSQLHSALPTVDWAFVDDLRLLQMEGEPDFVAEMTALFLKETPALLDAIRQSITKANPEGLRRAAHTLKGNCNSIGAKRMGALTLDLEKIGKEETTQGADALYAELEREFGNARKAFTEKSK